MKNFIKNTMKTVTKNIGKIIPTFAEKNWSKDNSYDNLTIVYRNFDNSFYISKKEVPANIEITNTEYWQFIIRTVGYSKEEIDIKFSQKQNLLTFDDIPTEDSINPVTSDGIKTYIDTIISALYKYKGTCVYAELPSSGNKIGDVWNVTDAHDGYPAGTNYAWDGTGWDALGGLVDFSNYYTKTEVDNKLSEKSSATNLENGEGTNALQMKNTGDVKNEAKASRSFAIGNGCKAKGANSVAEGYQTSAEDSQSHAEGNSSKAIGKNSHAEGYCGYADADASHAEGSRGENGDDTILLPIYFGESSNYPGWYAIYKASSGGSALTRKKGWIAIVYNDITYNITDAINPNNSKVFQLDPAFVETISGRVPAFVKIPAGALGEGSHIEGFSTGTYIKGSHAEGLYNKPLINSLHTVGCGTSSARKNAHLITDDGKHYIPGIGGYEGTEDNLNGKDDLATVINNGNGPFEAGDGNNSVAQKGSNGTAFGDNSIVEGKSTTNAVERGITHASTDNDILTEWASSSPESDKFSLAKGEAAHVEGQNGLALGNHSHVEGNGCIAANNSAHAEGTGSAATDKYAHAEGLETIASGKQSHAEGKSTTASESSAHAEGQGTKATQAASHAEGINTIAGTGSRPTADSSDSAGKYSHAEGNGTQASGNASHAEGNHTLAEGKRSHAEGMGSRAIGNQSHAEGNDTIANAWGSHAEGYNCETGGNYSSNTKTEDTDDNHGDTAHAEGNATIAQGPSSHSEGIKTFASGKASHAEGSNTTASGENSHAEGLITISSGDNSHAEGTGTTASGECSHAEGTDTAALGTYSHAEGQCTETKNPCEHAEGMFNKSNTGVNYTIHSVGIGTGNNTRRNAVEVLKDGSVYIKGIGNYTGDNLTDTNTKSLQHIIENLKFVLPFVVTISLEDPSFAGIQAMSTDDVHDIASMLRMSNSEFDDFIYNCKSSLIYDEDHDTAVNTLIKYDIESITGGMETITMTLVDKTSRYVIFANYGDSAAPSTVTVSNR